MRRQVALNLLVHELLLRVVVTQLVVVWRRSSLDILITWLDITYVVVSIKINVRYHVRLKVSSVNILNHHVCLKVSSVSILSHQVWLIISEITIYIHLTQPIRHLLDILINLKPRPLTSSIMPIKIYKHILDIFLRCTHVLVKRTHLFLFMNFSH